MNGCYTHVFAADGLNHIIWGSAQKLGDDGELVHMVLSGEERLALQHFGEDTACTPDINLHIVLLPSEHDLGGSVVTCGDITRHLGILNTRQTEIADFQIAVLIDENVAGLEVSMDHTSGVNILQATLSSRQWLCANYQTSPKSTYQNLVKEILNKLLLERSRSQKAVEISSQEFGDEIAMDI